MSAAAPKDAAEMPRNAENASGQTAEPVHKKAKKESGKGLSQAPRDLEEEGKFFLVRSNFEERMSREFCSPRSLPPAQDPCHTAHSTCLAHGAVAFLRASCLLVCRGV